MNVGSLFSGIGGLDLGLARAGFRHAFMCESDPWRRDILAARFPGVPIYEDVVRVGRLQPSGDTGDAWLAAEGGAISLDLLCGGFPCQDVSVAGRRAGLAGARSGLFHEFARIAESLRPRWLLVENVPGLLSSNGGRDFGTVLGTLADLGYGVAWRIVDSRYFGVPQRRRRVFIVGAVAGDDPRAAAGRAGQVLAVGTSCDRHPPAGSKAGQDTPVASLSGLGTGGPDDNDGQGGRLVASPLEASDGHHGYSSPRGDGADNLIAGPLGGGNDGIGDGGSSRLNQVLTPEANVRRLTPTECERLQALPDGWTQLGDTADSKRYAALGDAVTASASEWIGRRLLLSDSREFPRD